MTSPLTLKQIGLMLMTALIASGVVFALFHTAEYQRSVSPDGRFYAVAKYRAYHSILPLSVGGSGDKPGFATVFTKDGISCGSAPLPMLNFFTTLEWRSDIAVIPLVAEWDLSKRTVHKTQ